MELGLELRSRVREVFDGVSICLVDKSRAFCAGLAEALKTFDFQVHVFTDPTHVVDAILKVDVDIIIIGIEAGQPDCLELTKALRMKDKLDLIPILVFHDRPDSEGLLTTALSGANAFLRKEDVRLSLIPELVALLRQSRRMKESVIQDQLAELKRMISSCQHDVGNKLAIIDGKIRKLKKTHSLLSTDPSLAAIEEALAEVFKMVKKFNDSLGGREGKLDKK